MKQELKDILIKDLCARIPYHVMVRRPEGNYADYVSAIDIDAGTLTVLYNGYTDDIEKFVPYLRSMSSMTEKEKHIFDTMTRGYTVHQQASLFDWLNKKMFDYRGLIEMGLALEAPDGMYNLEKD